MTSDLSQTTQSVAISFKDFRDEEIVDFFANESRKFRPETAPNGFGRSRLVGAPHFPMERKRTAAFRVSFRSNNLQQKNCPPSVLRTESVGTIPIPPDIFTFAANQDIQTATIKNRSADRHSKNPKRKQIKTIEPSFGKSTRSLASVLMAERPTQKQTTRTVSNPLENGTKKSGLPSINIPINIPINLPINTPVRETEKTEKQLFECLRETDEQLDRLIETWPRLSSQLKETITTLLEISEKDELSIIDN
ncbi:MAG: hypothetical protein LBQ50_05645 [Planctomycetaceae bacterium]|jgi:hypothetical protein|nr:hypothetical protein [Planctomycetaceae bacterium]